MTTALAHDSATCRLGPDAGPCTMCVWAVQQQRARDTVEQSAAAIRARRAALLERADTHSPTEGAVALAEAWLSDEAWYRHLPNNAMQDAAVLELAGEIESVIGSYLQGRREEE